jgi:thioredoxin 1
MGNIIEITQDTFDKEVIEESLPVLVDFGAVWCGPCKMLDPLIEEISSEHAGKLKVVKVDVDHNGEIAMKYQIMSVPTLMLFSGGEVKERLSGYRPKNNIEKIILPYIS